MPTRFVCLANSFKEKGRCLAGIELDANNNPILASGRPKWIRPVCNTPHGEVPNPIAERFQILDVIELEITERRPESYQSENVFFQERSVRKTGVFAKDNLNSLCENPPTIFGNRGKAVSQEAITNLNHSLVLVSTNNFQVVVKTYPDNPDRKQTRLIFTYRETQYDFPITDPVFLHKHHANPNFINETHSLLLCLSLGVVWKEWYYKLVAGIIY